MKINMTLGVLTFAAIANGAPCSTSSVRGSYAFSAHGFTPAGSPVPPPLQGPFASGGTAVYDGRGNVALTASASFNGIIQSLGTVKGTYKVNSDCTFTSTLANGAIFYAVIVADGNEPYVLQTTPGVVASGVAVHQSPYINEDFGRFFGCQVSLYRGSYGFISTGTAGPPTLPPPAASPLAGVGTLSFDPRGTFKLTALGSGRAAFQTVRPSSRTGFDQVEAA